MKMNAEDTTMADISMASATAAQAAKSQKSRELFSCTIAKPTFAYAHLELVTTDDEAEQATLDALEVRSWCAAALKRFLGVAGAGMPIDVLKVQGSESWVRMPREDLGRFAAAITAGPGINNGSSPAVLRIRASGNWLGSLLARHDQHKLWTS